ncbi:replicative DNA helicase [Hyphomicrobium sp. DY-1]|uniref:replicative DNA helicase n=1 Tax=Hyphomicrobium sp. DY-1 TaxID=3075650 RepID=UPI0039C34653
MGISGNVRQLTIAAAGPSNVAPRTSAHSIPAEQALIAAVMVNNKLYDELGGSVRPEHFYIPLHAAVFEAMERLINVRGVEANPINLKQELKGSPFDAEKDLYPHLKDMFESGALASDVKSLAEVIQTTYVQRQMIGLADGVKSAAEKAVTPEDIGLILSQAGDELYRLSETGSTNTTRSVRESLKNMIEHAELARQSGTGIIGVASGFPDLDRLLGGFQRSDLIILGARPSMGKTSLLLNIAEHAAERLSEGGDNGAAVGIFSLEMSAEQLMQRLTASKAGINSQLIANGRLSDKDRDRMMAAAGQLADLPLYIDDTPALPINALRARARQMKRQYGIGVLIIDYLQLLTSPGKRSEASRVQEISDISQGLKQIARDLNIPVIAASQLSRSVEARDNKRPQLSDLRESGSIEQDADVVAFLYRDDYYISRALGGASETDLSSDADRRKVMEMKDRLEKARGITELIISKNRKGPTDTVRLLFTPETTSFSSYQSY